MPICTIEYSKPLADSVLPNELMSVVHHSVMKLGIFDEATVQVKMAAFDDYLTHNGKDNFLNVSLAILSGRTEAQKLELSNLVLDGIKALGLKSVAILVEVVEIEKTTFANANL